MVNHTEQKLLNDGFSPKKVTRSLAAHTEPNCDCCTGVKHVLEEAFWQEGCVRHTPTKMENPLCLKVTSKGVLTEQQHVMSWKRESVGCAAITEPSICVPRQLAIFP